MTGASGPAPDLAGPAAAAIAAIVIPTWNGRALLEGCLASLARQTAPPGLFRTIVVDNGSADGTVAWLRASHPAVEVVANARNEGFAAAMDQGIARAFAAPACRHAIALNNDTIADPGFVAALVGAAAAFPRAGSLQAKMLAVGPPGGPPRLDAAGIHLAPDLSPGQVGSGLEDDPDRFPPAPILGACAAACLYRREALEAVGPPWFEPLFFAYYEDVDLALRLRLAGFEARYIPAAAVHHLGSATAGRRSAFKEHFLARNRFLYILRSVPLDLILSRAPLVLGEPLFRLLHATFKGRLDLALARVRGLAAALRLLPAALAFRRRALRADPASANARVRLDRFVTSPPRRLRPDASSAPPPPGPPPGSRPLRTQ